MISTEMFKNYFQEQLNWRASKNLFALYANVGAYEADFETVAKDKILGIVSSLPSSILPLPGQSGFTLNYQLALMVPEGRVEEINSRLFKYALGVADYPEEKLSEITKNKDDEKTLAIISTDVPTVGHLEIRPIIGNSAPIYLTITLQCLKNAKLSNRTRLRIDSETIPTLTMSVQRAKIPQAIKSTDSEEIKNIMTEQSLVLSFTASYTDTKIMNKIADDIYKGGLLNKYLIDIEYREYGDFYEKCYLRDGVINYETGKMPMLSASFVIAKE